MKTKIKIEYLLKCSPTILFPRLSTDWGLGEWFSDVVRIQGKLVEFDWDGFIQKAEIISMKEDDYIKFKWLDEENAKTFFQFKITLDELTNDIILEVVDFAEEDDIDEVKRLWDMSIDKLRKVIGSK